ncbi:hypothetical protein PIROE2DRAFT_11552 [Piromyces sp. E2]|nr:hypothetical protein PIROE2DRAFT_11552 [Piromyces sp. E2]|eukprot:OUM62235.1 hypothetical protein PIROE2DRAFT_11552 [Piromyces sp. E2]
MDKIDFYTPDDINKIFIKCIEKKNQKFINKNAIGKYFLEGNIVNEFSNKTLKRKRSKKELEFNNKFNKFNSKRIKFTCTTTNNVLHPIDFKFDLIIKAYLFDIKFKLTNYITSNNVNDLDCYNNTILYYALLKEDLNGIKYLLEIGSNNYLNFNYDTIIFESLYYNLNDIFFKLFDCNKYIGNNFRNSENNTEIFKLIILNKNISLKDKMKMIKKILSVTNINTIYLNENLIISAMSILNQKESEALVSFLLKNKFKADCYENSLLYAKMDIKGNTELLIYFSVSSKKNLLNNLIKAAIDLKRKDILKLLFRNGKNIETILIINGNRKITMWKYAKIKNNSKMYIYLKNTRTSQINEQRKLKRYCRRHCVTLIQ